MKASPSPHPAAGPAAAAFSRQEEDQFTALVRENLPWAEGFARGFWVTDPELAVFEALRKALLRFDPDKALFSTFLRHVLVRELIDMIRSDAGWRGLSVPLAEDFEPVDEAASARRLQSELRDWLDAALDLLPAEEQELIRLKYDEDLSHKEIIEHL